MVLAVNTDLTAKLAVVNYLTSENLEAVGYSS